MSGISDTSASPSSVRFAQSDERQQQTISQAAFQQRELSDGSPWTLFYRQTTGYLLRFPELADFEVSGDGHAVQGWAAPGVKAATVKHLYLNQVLPLALSRQGKLVIHASAVDLGGQCVAFVGESGRGKSTLAASFATTGTEFLTDDGLQLEWRQEQLTVLPSHPSIRLWEDSQMALIGQTAAVAPAVEYTPKARFLASAGLAFCGEPRPLQSIFFLGKGEAPSIAMGRMKAPAALLELVRHSFLLDIDEQEMLALHFDEISRIANLPIHYHLDYPRRYEDLPLLRQAILRHANKGKECDDSSR